MRSLVGLDAGPMAALFIPDDAHHARAVEFVSGGKFSFFTTVPIITEVLHLLDFSQNNQLRCLEWIRRGAAIIHDLEAADWDYVAEAIAKYADLRPDFGDVSLLAVCDRLHVPRVATTDRDFQVYRIRKQQRLENMFPLV